jgi:23S rRNA-/tRNA-specific pseudouridylate synthase
MLANEISKVYYARVIGNFSEIEGIENNEITVKNMIYCVSNMDAFWECSQANEIKFEYRHKAKEAITKFKFKFYDISSNSSVIKCYPLTGRTHQIRVHLKHLGYPIAND